MVKFYVNRIKSGKMDIEDVRDKWRSKVEEELKEKNDCEDAVVVRT